MVKHTRIYRAKNALVRVITCRIFSTENNKKNAHLKLLKPTYGTCDQTARLKNDNDVRER